MKFPVPIYIRGAGELHQIITFGREPAQQFIDSADGVARIGGSLREPNYAQAYLHAAAMLVKGGEESNTLDEIALPAFYLQRHATELLLKQVLSMLIDISVYEARYEQHAQRHSAEHQKHLGGTHDLTVLCGDIRTLAQALSLTAPPAELAALVDAFAAIEMTETWPRYSVSRATKSSPGVRHMAQKMEVPLRGLQRKLEAASTATAYKVSEDNSYEALLYEEWFSYARHFGDVE